MSESTFVIQNISLGSLIQKSNRMKNNTFFLVSTEGVRSVIGVTIFGQSEQNKLRVKELIKFAHLNVTSHLVYNYSTRYEYKVYSEGKSVVVAVLLVAHHPYYYSERNGIENLNPQFKGCEPE